MAGGIFLIVVGITGVILTTIALLIYVVKIQKKNDKEFDYIKNYREPKTSKLVHKAVYRPDSYGHGYEQKSGHIVSEDEDGPPVDDTILI